MLQMVLASAAGSLSVADLARAGGEAMAAQTEIFGNRDWESFLIGSQRAMTGFMKAEPTMTALTAFQKVVSLEREALEALIGQVDPATTGLTEIAERLVAAVGGNAANLKGTPFGTQETLGVLAGLTGTKGQGVGANVVAAITGSIDEMRGRTEEDWRRQTEEPAAQFALAKDVGQRDTGSLLLEVARPASLAIVKHLPQIELAAMGLLAAWGGGKAIGMARRGISWWRGTGGASGASGGLAGAVGPSAVATMRVGTLIVSSMPGAGRVGSGPILSADGKLARSGTGGGVVSRTAGRTGRLAGAAGTIARVGKGIPRVGAGLAALTVVPALLSGDRRGAAQATAGLAGSWGGGVAGAKLGALIGTAMAPGVGTAIGAAIGGLGGTVAGWWAAERAAGAVLDAGAEDGEPRRAGRGRWRRGALDVRDTAPEVPVAPHAAGRVVNVDHQDHSRIEITVQGAGDPQATAEAVADEIERRNNRGRRSRARQVRELSLDDPRPDPAF